MAREIFKICRRQTWIKYVASLSSATPLINLENDKNYKNVHHTNRSTCLGKKGNSLTTDPNEISEALPITFQTNSSDDNYTKEFRTYK